MKLPSPVLTVALAVLLGTILDGLIKYLSGQMELVTIVFWRFFLASIAITAAFFITGHRMPGWKSTRFHAFRGVVHISAAYLFFFGLGKLELAEATALSFTATLLILPIAWLLLGERIHPWAGGAALLGFIGVLVTFNGVNLLRDVTPDRLAGLVAILCAAGLYAMALVMLRVRAAEDGSFAIAVYSNVFPALYMAPFALAFGDTPPIEFMPLITALAILGASVWVLMASGYARAPAQTLAPIEYTSLVWSALIGWVFFAEIPQYRIWIGAGFIIGACLMVAWLETRRT